MARPSRFSVVWTDTACDDLAEIVEHVAGDGEEAAGRVLDRLEAGAARLSSLPLRDRIVPELAAQSIRSYRELVVTPWRLVYRVDGSNVFVLAVLDGRRSLEDVLLERFLRDG